MGEEEYAINEKRVRVERTRKLTLNQRSTLNITKTLMDVGCGHVLFTLYTFQTLTPSTPHSPLLFHMKDERSQLP